MRFTDKVVLVLGGNSGMGLAAAQAFAAETRASSREMSSAAPATRTSASANS